MIKLLRLTSLTLVMVCLPAWLIGKSSGKEITREEIKWIKEHAKNIRYAPHPSWPPADFISRDSIHSGIVSDYIKLFEKKLGVSFQRVVYPSWDALLQGLKNGEADFVGSIHPDPARRDFVDYTDPYLNVPLVLLFRKDYSHSIDSSGFKDLQVAGVKSYSSANYLRKAFPGIQITAYEDDLGALMSTSLGNTDATVIDMMTASYLVQKYGITNLTLGHELDYSWSMSFGVRKDLPELTAILNKFLSSLSTTEKNEIYNKWVYIGNIQKAGFFQRNRSKIIIALGFMALIFLLTLFYSFSLKKAVASKTKALAKEIEEKNSLLESVNKSRLDYQFLFNHAGLPKWIYESDSLRIIEVNKVAIRHYGYSREEFLRMTIKDIRPPEDIPLLNRNIKESVTSGQNYHGIFRHLKKSGEIINVEVFTSEVDYMGKLCKIVSLNDVTEKLNALESLQQSVERYKYVTRATNEAIWDWDLKNGQMFWGEGYKTIFGWEPEDPADALAFWEECVHPDDMEEVKENLFRAIYGDDTSWTRNYRYRKKDGTYADVIDKAIILRDEEGNPIRLVGALQDVTERNQYIRVIEDQNAKLREIAWIQSHVVRAPVARIEGLLHLIRHEIPMNPKLKELFEHLYTSTNELDRITRDVFTKSENAASEEEDQ